MCFLFFSGDNDSRPDWMMVSASESALGLGGPSSSSEATGSDPLLGRRGGIAFRGDGGPGASVFTASELEPTSRAAGKETASTSLIAIALGR